MWPRILACFLLIAILSPALSGCAGHSADENDPATLFKDAEDDISSDRYQLAIDKLRVIKNKFPYSKLSVDAQLRIADVYFMQESYGEAALAYEAFRDLHPKHERVGYAMFRTGKSYFNDAPANIARDQTSTQKALDAYNDFLHRFPSANEAAEARKDANEARRILAEKELYIANFYFKRDNFESAQARYTKLISLYPETDAAKQAKDKLAEIEKASPKKGASTDGGSAAK